MTADGEAPSGRIPGLRPLLLVLIVALHVGAVTGAALVPAPGGG